MKFSNWREILNYARWAPSPHNTQHWKFQLIDDRRAIVLYDPTRLLPVEDRGNRFMTATFGILFETMSIAAAPLGLDIKVVPFGVSLDAAMKELMPFAELELCERTDPESLDRELIMERRTSRLPYDSRGIDQGVVAELVRTAEQFGHRLECCSDPQEIDWVINLNAETMFYDLRDDPTRNEIGHWIRYSRLDAEKRGDGLAAFALHFPGPLMRLFFRFNRLFTLPIIYGVAQWFYKRSMRGTRTVAWISGRFEENDDCLTAGRMLARLWLTMTKHGIYLHPFGSVITNKRSHQLLKVRFAATQRGEPPWLLVRLGYGDVPPRACRLPLHDLLVSQDCNS